MIVVIQLEIQAMFKSRREHLNDRILPDIPSTLPSPSNKAALFYPQSFQVACSKTVLSPENQSHQIYHSSLSTSSSLSNILTFEQYRPSATKLHKHKSTTSLFGGSQVQMLNTCRNIDSRDSQRDCEERKMKMGVIGSRLYKKISLRKIPIERQNNVTLERVRSPMHNILLKSR